MKLLIAFAAALLVSGSAHAGCGTKIPVEGELSEYDAEKKLLKVGRQSITLAASAVIKDAEGGRTKIEDLLGKMVVVSTDKHTKQGESVTAKADEDSAPPKPAKAEMKSNLLAESQEWTNSSGVTITAAVQKVEKGVVYFLKDGKVIPYEVSKLSEETIDKLKAIVAERAKAE